MNKFVKSLLALGITSALSISLVTHVNAATYKIVDIGEVDSLKYTYAQQQNDSDDMALSGTNLYNFPVQFDYLDAEDFVSIISYSANNYLSVNGLTFIEDANALVEGKPTGNDLAWVLRWLQDSKGSDIEYQKVGDTIAMTNINDVTREFNIFDEKFEDSDSYTRSTIDIISGITDSGIAYGTATAPYLPSDVFTDADGVEHIYWLREHGIRGFFSDELGAEVFEVEPFNTDYIGGYSAVMDVSDSGVAVGFSSYKVSQAFEEQVTSSDGGCADPDIIDVTMTYDACVATAQLSASSDIYHSMALKATVSLNGRYSVEELGLLVTPHEDDERAYSSYALAVNSKGVAVGYADGFDDETVTSPSASQARNYHYAVVYKNGNVIDLTGEHEDKASSRAYDINDSDIAVGHIVKAINGKAVQKFFYVDTNVDREAIKMVTPDDYFSGSDSTARAINEKGLIVGEGEIETHNESSSNPRRTAAFVYDMNNDTFKNLNELIPCSLRDTYDIIEARGISDGGINNLGIISATAVVKMDRRDAKGEYVLDDNGDTAKEDVVRAIRLEPIEDDGEVCTAAEEGKVVRQGASVGFSSVWLLLGLIGLRRKLFN